MRKVVIIGSGGAGKSTLARRLGEMTGLPVIHLDRLCWGPGWDRMEKERWAALQAELVQEAEWIMDGNYKGTLPIRLAAADTVLFLDYPKWLCAWRALMRVWAYRGQTRPDMGGDNVERLNGKFFWWILTYPRGAVLDLLDGQREKGKSVLVMRHPRETERFMAGLAKEKAAAERARR